MKWFETFSVTQEKNVDNIVFNARFFQCILWDPSFVAATCVSSRRHFVDYRTIQKVWTICLWNFVVPTFMGNACSGKVVLFFMVSHAHVMNTEKRPNNSASCDGGGEGKKREPPNNPFLCVGNAKSEQILGLTFPFLGSHGI